MSRVSSESVLARARDLIDGYRPRSFIDAVDVPEVLEWSEAVPARVVSPPEPVVEPITVEESQLHIAQTQAIVLVLCGRCGRRHFEPLLGYQGNAMYVCKKCGAANRRPSVPTP